ncbi:hypothetical protein VQ056_06845 [Paenibacillus sp. JTLBN-2024]
MRGKSTLSAMLLRNYIFFSLTVGASVLLVLLFRRADERADAFARGISAASRRNRSAPYG